MSNPSIVRVAVYGASGRVGKLVVEAVLAAPDLELTAAMVSGNSDVLGQPVPGCALSYATLGAKPCMGCDVVVDFSKPTAVMALIEAQCGGPVPLVIGTTGFDADQQDKIALAARRYPVVMAANFGRGFPAFLRLATDLAAAEPGAAPRVGEVYHARKKAEPSGTSRLLAEAVAAAGGRTGSDIAIDVGREGETVGINAVAVDLGPAMIEVRYTVKSLASYAEGALAAARWVIGRGPSLYGLADIGRPG